jgi:rhodanese-related sulfurtransferase
MPTAIGLGKLRTLTGQGAALVEVLTAEDYHWAHLPGAINLPLKELDGRIGQLDRSRPGHRVLPRHAVRHEPAGCVAARSGRVRPGV